MKVEHCVLKSGKIWVKCISAEDAIETAKYYNSIKDENADEYLPCSRKIGEWNVIS